MIDKKYMKGAVHHATWHQKFSEVKAITHNAIYLVWARSCLT